MKRAMTTVLAVGLVGGLGLASVASAQDYTLYGSVRAGLYGTDPETGDSTWDIGAQDSTGDRLFSRIGVRASYDLGNGMSSGLHIERNLNTLGVRHQNVWLGWEGAGRLTFGQQSSAYDDAITWDGASFLGGNASQGAGSRVSGIKFASDLGGPFSFQIMLRDDDSAVPMTGAGDGLDEYQVAASMALGDMATISAAYIERDDEYPMAPVNPASMDFMGFAAKGSMAGLSWMAGYENGDHNTNGAVDRDSFGVFLSYAVGNSSLYLEYEDRNAETNVYDNDYLLLGYSHSLGTNTTLIAEYMTPDTGANLTAIALKVDF